MKLEKIGSNLNPEKPDIWSVENKGTLIKGEQKATFEKLSKPAEALTPEEDAKLKKACKDFESFFLYYLLKEMRAAVPKEGIMEDSAAQEIYQDMFDEKIADRIAKTRGMGLSDMLYKQVKQGMLQKTLLDIQKEQRDSGKV
jgi:peptidoglycan hydrolase FlgJ